MEHPPLIKDAAPSQLMLIRGWSGPLTKPLLGQSHGRSFSISSPILRKPSFWQSHLLVALDWRLAILCKLVEGASKSGWDMTVALRDGSPTARKQHQQEQRWARTLAEEFFICRIVLMPLFDCSEHPTPSSMRLEGPDGST